MVRWSIATLVLALLMVLFRPPVAVASTGPPTVPVVDPSAATDDGTAPVAAVAPAPAAPTLGTRTGVAGPGPSRAAATTSGLPVTGATSVGPRCGGSGSDGVRVQVVYAFTGAVADPARRAAIAADAANADQAYVASAARTGGNRQVRWVTDSGTAGCRLSILDKRITTGATGFDALRADLTAQGLTDVTRKYLVWTEGALAADASTCGLGEFWSGGPGDDRPGPDNPNATNAGGSTPTFAAVKDPCWDMNGGHSVPAHELMHMLGAVQETAPHAANSGHCSDENDAMCYGPGVAVVAGCTDPAGEALFDCNNDDYFHTDPVAGSYLCDHWDTARSPFLWNNGVNQPPRAVAEVVVVPGPGTVSVTWPASPSCVPPDAYVVAVTGSPTVTVPGTVTSVVRPASPGNVTVTITPSRAGVDGPSTSTTGAVPTPPTTTTTTTTIATTTTTTTTPPPPATPPPPPATPPPPDAPPVGQLLLWKVDRRGFGLFGDAFDPDTTEPITVRVDMDGVGTTYVRADFSWDGSAGRHPGYGTNHGFLYLRGNLPRGTRNVCVTALDSVADGPSTLLGCTRIVVK